jgi:hypothetical protein
MTITLTPEVEEALCKEAARQNKPAEKVANEKIAQGLGLRGWRVPQSLDGTKPRQSLPPGKTLKDVLDELPKPEWSDEETDEKLLAALKAMG